MNIKKINSVKWDFMHIQDKRAKADTLPFWIADMDFPCPPPLLEAIRGRLVEMPLGYSMVDEKYRSIVCSWMKKKFSWTISPSSLFTSAGVVRALKDLILCLTNPGDGVIIQQPVYYPFAAIIRHSKRTLVNNPLQHTNGHYTIDFVDLRKKAKNPSTTMMILCSPHNPVGRVWTEDELRQVGEICQENSVQLISDEIHFDLLRKNISHTPIATMFPEDDTVITCTAPSKTFNTAGLQISNIIINNPLLQKKWRLQTGGEEFTSPLSITAVKAAYTQCDDWLAQLIDYLDANFLFMQDFLEQNLPEIRFTIPEGTYLGWIDFSRYGLTDQDLATVLIERGNVLLEGGTIFGPEGTGFQRMNVSCPRTTLEEDLQRIAKAFS